MTSPSSPVPSSGTVYCVNCLRQVPLDKAIHVQNAGALRWFCGPGYGCAPVHR